ncbi:MAG: phosphate butyryltransferase [Clostridioides sp.]|jgi:phosphate butyryltransferase|nr:phosphate butyryltransferase [Clostridioides sp.]
MKSIKDICKEVAGSELKTIAIAGISEEEINLVKDAIGEKLANFILVDEEIHTKKLIKKYGLDEENIRVVPVDCTSDAPAKAIELVKQGIADIPMKGQVHTSTFMKAILDKEKGISSGSRLSQMTMFDGYNGEPQFLTDCAINISPTLKEKVEIIQNAVEVFKNLYDKEPYVALLGAVETISEKMPDTIDSAVITQMNRRGQIKDCIIDGPLSLDNAISKKYAEIKNIESSVAGKAQILVSSDLREANNVSKAIIHYSDREACSIIAGTKVPVVMTSRTDKPSNKINTIGMACYLLQKKS